MTFTIVIPVFNGAQTVRKAIASIKKQTYTDYTVIIINDGSTDDTLEVLRPLLSNGIELVNLQTNGGLTNALRVGVRSAKSDWIARLDADDFWYPDHLKK